MFLQIGQAEYNDITFALEYTIRELEMLILNGKLEPKHFSDILESLKETEKSLINLYTINVRISNQE